ncbi:unnamed protein product [Angiostrongylus costaricensis]|uniref:Uncharacterized protein n=1 Tax=Angiostrongylus costaricensis TaxID=334426 RepID=A0A0R3PKK6_ANGCS|nr:unnamed protein product [Angiostrongylus costaricensis]
MAIPILPYSDNIRRIHTRPSYHMHSIASKRCLVRSNAWGIRQVLINDNNFNL